MPRTFFGSLKVNAYTLGRQAHRIYRQSLGDLCSFSGSQPPLVLAFPLPSSEPLGDAEAAFFGKTILRFGATFGVPCFFANEFPPWSITLSCFSSDSMFSAIWAAWPNVLDEKCTGC
jgi:hypothetical protein